ncbi:pyridoxal-phosphate dependent enzyme [Kocuria sp. HSID16901]|uniref:pyridoxal-phosphate dependent enzyme n=1 Tax=Kocuria sp. HSID16901 TaxID=2419505 RepID=UPI0009E64328|nr:pyridoxal-phosphate dependent enzyme [Kocuria sp. HSID16901]RUQ23321.1 pyridoxal-phosphate dependent enzyme [Kocuria sp. HSID16901]
MLPAEPHAPKPGLPQSITTHAGQALGAPDLISLEPNLYALRFEVMKAWSARAALEHLLEIGKISPGDTVIDSSSGIYACALAMACHEYDLKCYIIGSTTIDPVLRAQLAMFGAELEQMPPSMSLRADQDLRVARVLTLLEHNPEWHWMQQYHDDVHCLGYGPLAHAAGKLLADEGVNSVELVAPVGSGVSSAALATGLAESGLDVSLTGIQPFGSVTFGSEDVEDPDMLIAGIGSSIPFRNVRHDMYERIHWVSYRVSRAGSVSLCRDHALFAGLSSGAAYAVARDALSHPTEPHHAVLMICPDTGHRYLDPVFTDIDKVPAVTQFSPHHLSSASETPRLPWSAVHWGGHV